MTAMLHRYIGVAAVPGFQGRLSDPRPVHLPELLGLRGVAILIIVCGHLLHRICPFQTELVKRYRRNARSKHPVARNGKLRLELSLGVGA
jgi:peptidoglycan/LPS O-acetylase OafA/YrhL